MSNGHVKRQSDLILGQTHFGNEILFKIKQKQIST